MSHGVAVVVFQGGVLVGSEVAGKRVLIVDDVITAGTAVRESLELLREAGAVVAAVVLALDREETAGTGAGAGGATSAVQQVQREFGIPVISIVRYFNTLIANKYAL
jgi:orotate phosphoribosyltransferase